MTHVFSDGKQRSMQESYNSRIRQFGLNLDWPLAGYGVSGSLIGFSRLSFLIYEIKSANEYHAMRIPCAHHVCLIVCLAPLSLLSLIMSPLANSREQQWCTFYKIRCLMHWAALQGTELGFKYRLVWLLLHFTHCLLNWEPSWCLQW